MERRNFLQVLGASIGAALLGTKHKGTPGDVVTDAVEPEVHDDLVQRVGRLCPRIPDNPGLRIEVDGTLYVGGEFTAGVWGGEYGEIATWSAKTWQHIED